MAHRIINLSVTVCVFFFAASFGRLQAQQTDPWIWEVINHTNVDSLTYVVKELSGEVPTLIGGLPDTIQSRAPGSRGHAVAVRYLTQKLQSYGLTVQLHVGNSSDTSVIAKQTGTDFPNRKYIVCAHYDDVPVIPAPGADDNASGTAVVLEAARLFSKYRTSYTIVYALWDQEESGLIGSTHYAQQARASGDTILGVLNLDMIGWDSNNDGLMDIHARDTAQSVQLADTVTLVNNLYGIGLKPTIYNPGSSASDHASFWFRRYSAVLLIEAYSGGDFNSHYHTNGDKIQYFNSGFFTGCSKLALGSLALLASIKGPLGVDDFALRPRQFALEQNYPNPFNPRTTIRFELQHTSRVSLKVFTALGQEVAALVDGDLPAGLHAVQFDGSRLASGVYFYRLQAGASVATKKLLLLK